MFRKSDVNEVLEKADLENNIATRTMVTVGLYGTAVIVYPFMLMKYMFKKK